MSEPEVMVKAASLIADALNGVKWAIIVAAIIRALCNK